MEDDSDLTEDPLQSRPTEMCYPTPASSAAAAYNPIPIVRFLAATTKSTQSLAMEVFTAGCLPLLPPGRRDLGKVPDEAITLIPGKLLATKGLAVHVK